MKWFLAVFAVLFLLLRPLCDVQAAGPAHDERAGHVHTAADRDWRNIDPHSEVPSCATLEDGAQTNPGEAAATRVDGGSELAFAAPSWAVSRHTPVQSLDVRQRPGVLFTRTSYYAQSARIQR